MKKKRKIKRWIILALVCILLVVFWVTRSRNTVRYAQTVASVGDISTSYSFTGSVISTRTQTLVAPTAAKVRDIYVQANDWVEEGDRLLKLSTGDVLRAEIDGEIARLNVQTDDLANAGDVLASVVDMTRLEAEVSVDEYDIEAIEVGREVDVSINALGETVQGVLSRFDKEAMSSAGATMASYKAYITFEAPEKTLPGMQVEVKMINQSAEDVLLIKMDALQFDAQNRAYVLTQKSEGEYQETYVETGISDGVNVQIISGLSEGETVYYPSSELLDMMMAMRGGR